MTNSASDPGSAVVRSCTFGFLVERHDSQRKMFTKPRVDIPTVLELDEGSF